MHLTGQGGQAQRRTLDLQLLVLASQHSLPSGDKMQKYWGLRGSRITWAALIFIVGPAYTAFGYNQGVAGNVLTLPSFVQVFSQIDTVNTSGAQEQHNSTIQGMYYPESPSWLQRLLC